MDKFEFLNKQGPSLRKSDKHRRIIAYGVSHHHVCYSKCSKPWTVCISINWEPVRNMESRALHQNYGIRIYI